MNSTAPKEFLSSSCDRPITRVGGIGVSWPVAVSGTGDGGKVLVRNASNRIGRNSKKEKNEI